MKSSDDNKPHLIITVGIPGSGKSFFAEHFAKTFQAPIISFDQLRKEIFTNPAFSDDEDEIISKVAYHMLGEILKTGRTIIYEGQTSLRTHRAIITKKAREAGYDTLFVWVQTEPATAKKRALKPSVEKAALTSEEFDNKLKRFSAPHAGEKAVVISGKHTYVSQLKIILKHLSKTRALSNEQTNSNRTSANRSYLIR